MPALETHDLRQTALLFPYVSVDQYGRYLVDPPVELRPKTASLGVRWIDVESEALDAQGNTIRLDASVVLGRDADIGSLLWLGSLDDVDDANESTTPDTGLVQIKTTNNTLDLKARGGRRTRREYGVIRWPRVTIAPRGTSSLASGLVGFYRKNGTDYSGYGRRLARVGSPVVTTGLDGATQSAMSFPIPGTDYYSRSYNWTPGGDITLSGFAYFSGASTGNNYLVSNAAGDIVLGCDANNCFFKCGAQITGPNGSGVPVGSGWVHFLGTRRDNVLKLFVGGVLLASGSSTTPYTKDSVISVAKTSSQIVRAQYVGAWERFVTDGNVAVGAPVTSDSEVYALRNGNLGFDPTV